MGQETIKKHYTLCLVQNKNCVLLGMKKRGFGQGRWNGFGGKVKEGETIEEALHREIAEEAGVNISEPEKRGVLTFSFEGKPEMLEVYIFGARAFDGIPQESEEMKPQWFEKNAIPFEQMWPDDRFWFPLFLAGKKFRGSFHFKDQNTILRHILKEVGEI